MRSITATLTGVAAASALALGVIAPASGVDESNADRLGQAAGAMLKRIDVPYELGAPDKHTISSVEAGKLKPLLCVAKKPWFARKGKRYYESDISLVGTADPVRVTQRVHVYEHIEFARHAFQMVIERARKCQGVHKNADYVSGIPTKPQRIVLDSGRTFVRSEGKKGVWIMGNFARKAAETTWAEDWYTVYLRVGHTVMAFTYAVDPIVFGANVTQQRALHRLANTLAIRWLETLGKNWH